jgi:hypothetical protein
MQHEEDGPIDIVPPEKIAFIAYNIGVYESVQRFGTLITTGRVSDQNGSNISYIAQSISEATAFYGGEMISTSQCHAA